MFDLFCTVSMIIDLSLHGMMDGSSVLLSQMRFFRLLRIMRALRLFRSLAFATALRRMVFALQHAIGTLLWAFVLLLFIMYFFALALTQSTTDSLVAAGVETTHLTRLRAQYGSLPRSYLSLFLSITGGVSWGELIEDLGEYTHWLNSALFVTFIAITVFGVLNVITSVFVESALQSVQHHKDLLIESSAQQREVAVAHLKEVFAYIDDDNSGEISLEEMEAFVSDEHLKEYLEGMGIRADDVHTLFCLLDVNNSGSIDIGDFCEGCLKMKGEAKSYDIQYLMFENKRMLHKWEEFMDYLDTGFIPNLMTELKTDKQAQGHRTSL